jgi:hypothetical protein
MIEMRMSKQNLIDGCGIKAERRRIVFVQFPSTLEKTAINENAAKDQSSFDKFLNNNIHEVLNVCAELRPSVDISVVPTRGS